MVSFWFFVAHFILNYIYSPKQTTILALREVYWIFHHGSSVFESHSIIFYSHFISLNMIRKCSMFRLSPEEKHRIGWRENRNRIKREREERNMKRKSWWIYPISGYSKSLCSWWDKMWYIWFCVLSVWIEIKLLEYTDENIANEENKMIRKTVEKSMVVFDGNGILK